MSRREDYMKGEPKKGIQLWVRNADGTLQVNEIAATSFVEATRLPDKIKEALPHDSFARTVRENPEGHPNFEDQNGFLKFEGLIYVPTRIMRKCYRHSTTDLYEDTLEQQRCYNSCRIASTFQECGT